MRANLGDGLGFSLMVGLGESYLPAFALALGMGEVVSGLVASVPMMAGALLQLASPFAVRKLGSHRRWVIFCATCQALSFVPLVVAALDRPTARRVGVRHRHALLGRGPGDRPGLEHLDGRADTPHRSGRGSSPIARG